MVQRTVRTENSDLFFFFCVAFEMSSPQTFFGHRLGGVPGPVSRAQTQKSKAKTILSLMILQAFLQERKSNLILRGTLVSENEWIGLSAWLRLLMQISDSVLGCLPCFNYIMGLIRDFISAGSAKCSAPSGPILPEQMARWRMLPSGPQFICSPPLLQLV